jgi:hypothetical protein
VIDRRTGWRQEAQEPVGTATTIYREMDMCIWLEQAEAHRNAEEAAMEFDSQTERLPFHEPDEAEPAPPGAAAVL